MADYDSLLYPVFNELRRQGVPLGIQDYLLAVKTIREGIGLDDLDAFKHLCCLLWTKSREDQERFNVAFAKWVEPQLKPAYETGVPSFESMPPPSQSNQEIIAEEEGELVHLAFHPLTPGLQLPADIPPMHQMPYHLTPRLPIGRREMIEIWRHLRRLRREGAPEELDVEGTIQKTCRTGFFLGPVFRPRKRNQVKLVLLIDQQGSMMPFSLMIEALIDSVLHAGLWQKPTVYYFHDCPEYVICERPNLTIVRYLEEVLLEQAKGNSVLIVSDAGAARGYYSRQRVDDTRAFLKALSTYTYLYAWLNPVPSNRWEATSAEDIACKVPMFHLDREGLNDAIDILRGHPFPSGVGLDE